MKESRGLIVTFVPLFMLGVALWFWPGTAAFADDKHSSSHHDSPSPSGHEGDHDGDHHDGEHKSGHEGDESEKCIVCHNPHNFHEISIPCDQVDKFLRDHPGDFRGHCHTTPNTNK